MNVQEWARVKQICLDALARDITDRTTYLKENCGDDQLFNEVHSLLSFEPKAEQHFNELSPEFVAAAFIRNRSLVGCRVGNYSIKSLLGRGGMGEVYLAEDTELCREVALKVLPKQFTHNEQPLQRFKQEARAASGLKHRNIITIYSVGHADGVYFIATEYVPGLTLRQQLADSGRMELRAAVEIAMQVASALESAHRAGIVHRDIKPENIMFEPDGTAKLLDFGIAKLTENLSAESNVAGAEPPMTEQNVILGTPAYMSPEQARHQTLDHRSDLFSLGVVFYEMITGKVPFSGATSYDQQAAVLVSEPTPLSQFLDSPIPELKWVVNKALAKEPGRRYQSATDLLIDLELLRQRLVHEGDARAASESGHGETIDAVVPNSAQIEHGSVVNRGWQTSSRRGFLTIALIIIFVITVAIISLTGQGRRLGGLVGLTGPRPVIESIVPNHPIDIIGNQPIAVQGRHFQNGLKLTVGFPNGDSGELSGAQIQKRKDDSTRFNILIDLNGNPGLYSLQVVNPDNQVSPRFTFQARHESVRPLISWIEPANVNKSVGEQLLAVYGSNFQHGVKVEVIQPNGDTSELRDRQIANQTPNSFHGLFFFHLPGKHSIRVVNPNGGKSEYFDILVQ